MEGVQLPELPPNTKGWHLIAVKDNGEVLVSYGGLTDLEALGAVTFTVFQCGLPVHLRQGPLRRGIFRDS